MGVPSRPMVEIERRFLCGEPDPGLLEGADRRHRIEQGYLAEVGATVRIRRIDGDHVLTVKSGHGPVRDEVEVPLDASKGERLLRICGSRRVTKRRYRVGRWEVDLFDAALEGLVLAEVELSDEEEPLPDPPAGLPVRREITGEPGLSNRALASLSPADARARVRELAG